MKMSDHVHPAFGKIPDSLAMTFGLRGFPGKTFVLNLRQSYNDQLVVDICSLADGTQQNFSRGTLEELMREVVPAPPCEYHADMMACDDDDIDNGSIDW